MNITDLHPLNAVGLMLNGSMLLTLVICITLGRRRLKRKRKSGPALTLLTEPRQCLHGLRRIAAAPHGYHLPRLSEEDRL